MKPGLLLYLLPPAIAWLVAQFLKVIINHHKPHKSFAVAWRSFFESGDMPSSHAACTVSFATIVGIVDGVNSGLFAVSVVLMIVVIYDAVKVRRSSGEQGLALRKLLGTSKFKDDPLPFQALGHKPIEVIAGSAIGITVALIVAFFITK